MEALQVEETISNKFNDQFEENNIPEKELRKIENLSEFCVLEGISEEKCKKELETPHNCYIESCKHCCFITLNGHSYCISKCKEMKNLLKNDYRI